MTLGFSLHLGWALEGAIGSDFKVDAAYLSPNVEVAGALEEYTREYGSPLLFTATLYDQLTEDMQVHCRQIDCLKFFNGVEP